MYRPALLTTNKAGQAVLAATRLCEKVVEAMRLPVILRLWAVVVPASIESATKIPLA